MQNNTLVVISHYASRGSRQLSELLSQISRVSKNILIVVNDDQVAQEVLGSFIGYPAIFRPNIGMNIGGWDAVFRNYSSYKYYVFLQDECSLIRDDFISAYEVELAQSGVGMTGESINNKWDRPWIEMLKSPLNYFVSQNLTRVEHYLYLMRKWNVDPGSTGRHLRSLVWGFNHDSLARLGGFPVGKTKEECIAAEISVSKKIEELGLRVTQISDIPFSFFRHQEWRSDGTSKI